MKGIAFGFPQLWGFFFALVVNLSFVSCSGVEPEEPSFEPAVITIEYDETISYVAGIGYYRGFSSQGLAIYDKYAFLTYDTGYVQVLDCDSMEIISSFAMPEGVQHRNNHAGMANFGNKFYEDGDKFPLMYVSSYIENKCYVLRVDLSGCELIQEIQMDDSWHFFVDDSDNLVVRLNDNNYFIFDVPSYSQKSVALDKRDAKDSFYFNIPNMHYAGAFCSNGIMNVLCYYKRTPEGIEGRFDRLVQYDYTNKKVISQSIFRDAKIRSIEFEGIAIKPGGDILISFMADQVAILSSPIII